MARVNPHFQQLPGSYLLLRKIGRRTAAYQEADPRSAAQSRMGIGDVTQALAPAVVEAMHAAVDDLCCRGNLPWLRPRAGLWLSCGRLSPSTISPPATFLSPPMKFSSLTGRSPTAATLATSSRWIVRWRCADLVLPGVRGQQRDGRSRRRLGCGGGVLDQRLLHARCCCERSCAGAARPAGGLGVPVQPQQPNRNGALSGRLGALGGLG